MFKYLEAPTAKMKRFNSVASGLICPVCDGVSCIIQQRLVDVDQIGRVLKINLSCPTCFHRETDFVPLIKKRPTRVEFRIEEESDLEARIVKSNTCRLKIPELDIHLEPDPESASIISNVDEVLKTIDFQMEFEYKKQKVNQAISNVRDGLKKVTLILEDPAGVSTIISKKVKRHII